MVVAWACVATTILFTIYGQIVIKWQVRQRGALPGGLHAKLAFLVHLVADPWVLSALLGGFVAALAWMAALSKLELSRAYPFTALSFVVVLVLSGVFFDEQLTPAKLVGVALVIAGLVVGASL
jgi:multidrug transporter EmrE-like cation transporter